MIISVAHAGPSDLSISRSANIPTVLSAAGAEGTEAAVQGATAMTSLPRLISVDDHVLEPPDIWTSRLPAN